MIYLFLAEGFEEVEAITPLDYIRRCDELKVLTVGIGGKRVTGSHGIVIECDIEENEIEPDDIEMIILPGGMPGTLNLEKSNVVSECIDLCAANKKYIAAICAAPSILGHKGVLQNKKAVCYPGFEEQLLGAVISYESVCRDGNIITAKGAGAANQFAFEIIACLLGEERAKKLKEAVQWKD